jgi:hypothetical protein
MTSRSGGAWSQRQRDRSEHPEKVLHSSLKNLPGHDFDVGSSKVDPVIIEKPQFSPAVLEQSQKMRRKRREWLKKKERYQAFHNLFDKDK